MGHKAPYNKVRIVVPPSKGANAMNPIKNILFLAAILGLSLSGGQATAETGFGQKAPHTQFSGNGLQLIRDHGHSGHPGGMMGRMLGGQTTPPPSSGLRMAPPPPSGESNLSAPSGGFTKRHFSGNEIQLMRPQHPPYVGGDRPKPDHPNRHRHRHFRGFFWYNPVYPDYSYNYYSYYSDYDSCYSNCRQYHSRRYCRKYWRNYCN